MEGSERVSDKVTIHSRFVNLHPGANREAQGGSWRRRLGIKQGKLFSSKKKNKQRRKFLKGGVNNVLLCSLRSPCSNTHPWFARRLA